MQTVELAGRVLVSLAAVLAVIWFLARKLNRGNKRASTTLIDVLGRQRLTNNASVAVVRIGEKALIVGVTDTQVNVLGETDLTEALAQSPARSTAAASVPAAAPAARRAVGSRRATTTRRAPSSRRSSSSRHAPSPRASLGLDGASPVTSEPQGRLVGSALSPQTWRQTVESLRDLTAH